ncbi:hypothetical protein PCANC_24392 [Puccinia coronata f. sp. avenae]|uniref:BCAS3 WD40 domain-containing protein n=1 Tax=Puccinia coronata f. sp. avenae TaxID=200324 RepID=A0A2N5TYM7_9BASI|nr:hypothetical protein PCANC_24392 [Puccinia coronata f. sp. avenae]
MFSLIDNELTQEITHSQPATIICPPSLIREPTRLESLSSTFQSFPSISLTNPFRSHNHPYSADPHSNSTRNTQKPHSPISLLPPSSSLLPHLTHPDRIHFSTWIQFNHRRHLLSINPTGIAVWDTEDLEALEQVVWIRWDHLHHLHSKNHHHHQQQQQQQQHQHHPHQPFDYLSNSNPHLTNLEPISATILPSNTPSSQMLLAILFNSLSDRSSKLAIISANTGTIIHSLDLPGIGLELQVNQKIMAIATKSPLAIHLYKWHSIKLPSGLAAAAAAAPPNQFSLVKLPCSPILDLAPKPKSGNPVFSLGSTRLLVYASSTSPSEREPLLATGTGFSFTFPPLDSRSPPTHQVHGRESKDGSNFGLLPSSYSATRHSSHTGISGSSWKHSVAPNLDAIDETARKLGGNLWTGAKYLSSLGQTLWNPQTDSLHSPRQAAHQLPRNDLDLAFSQSAPVPHMMSAARPTSSARAEESYGTYGNVKVIDLFSAENHIQHTSHGHRHHAIFHFKASSDPLTFLSFNPSSNLLLTSSVDGHSFHVFELRPSSRVGKSYLNSCRPQAPHSSRQATVWHRYKLTRGFTSAEVTNVVWRWDSKVVSVLTEHGTHHLFAIHPAGGTPTTTNINEAGKSSCGMLEPLSAIFGPRVHNPRTPPPLSVTVSAFEKIKHKVLRHPSLPQSHESAGHMSSLGYLDYHPNEHDTLCHLPHLQSTSLIFPQPTRNVSSDSPQNHAGGILSESHKRSPSALLHDPSTNSVTMYNFESKKTLLNSVADGVSSSVTKHSASGGGSVSESQQPLATCEVQKKANPSGLSQLMQQAKQTDTKLNGHELHAPPGNLVIGSFAPAVWHLSAMEHSMKSVAANRFYQTRSSTHSSPPSKSPPESKPGYLVHQISHGPNWTSFAELDTFSHSLRILPRSIYLCHQFDFYHFASAVNHNNHTPSSASHHRVYHPSLRDEEDYISRLSHANFEHIKKIKLVVKREVQIQPGDLSTSTYHRNSPNLSGMSTVEIDDHFVNHYPAAAPGSHESTDSSSSKHHHHMYAEPLRSAVETVMDSTIVSPKSSSQFFPEFPNGHPGRRSSIVAHHSSPLASLKKSVAENVVPVVGVVNERVRKELEKITSSGVMGEVNRRRFSVGLGGYYSGISRSLGQHHHRGERKADPSMFDGDGAVAAAYSEGATTSLSFEDDQDSAIRIDRSLFDAQGPSSSSMTSFTTTHSLPRAPSDDVGLPRASRPGGGGGGPLEDNEDASSLERWEGWAFEDDFDLKASEPTTLRLASSPNEPDDAFGGRAAGPEPVWIKPAVPAKTQSTPSPDGLAPPGGQAASEPTSGSRSSSALSTSTSASASGADDARSLAGKPAPPASKDLLPPSPAAARIAALSHHHSFPARAAKPSANKLALGAAAARIKAAWAGSDGHFSYMPGSAPLIHFPYVWSRASREPLGQVFRALAVSLLPPTL